MTVLSLGNQSVEIDKGELVGYKVDGFEFMHQKGNPGWRSVDTEMFPLIGPTSDANFRVKTPRGKAIQDQHGLCRELTYSIAEKTTTKASFKKVYKANTAVINSKYPKKSIEEQLSWPYDFKLVKTFELLETGLKITFDVSGDKGMPFMLGYHPAFMLRTTDAVVKVKDKNITIPEIKAEGSRALEVPNVNSVLLVDEKSLQISTKGFSSFMLWTEVDNMVCIEPITFYSYKVKQENLFEGFEYLDHGPQTFSIELSAM